VVADSLAHILPSVPPGAPEVLVNPCGVSNRAGAGLQVCKWPMHEVRICVEGDLPTVPHADFLAIFQAAVKWWSDIAQLDLAFVDSPSQANIYAKVGRAGPIDQFDGPQGVLAWCELPCGNVSPQSQLQMRFDPAEAWTDRTLMFLTIAHEIGHGFGLPHSQFKGNLMQPYLNLNLRELGADDRSGIWGRYGRRTTPPPAVPPPSIPGGPSGPSGVGTLTLDGKTYRIVPA
jgi:hypothetical protein